jgi:hypothetical protein
MKDQITSKRNNQSEAMFRQALRWLAKSAPKGVNKTRWLIKHGLVTKDGQYLTRAGRKALERSKGVEHIAALIDDKQAEQFTKQMISEMIEISFAKDVAEGRIIRLIGDRYVNAQYFEPAKHKRAEDILFLEMTRADIESAIVGDHDHRYNWSLLLSVAELTGWPETGSPAIWLIEHEYLERSERGFRWTSKATMNSKLAGKLKRLPTLFSPPGRARAEHGVQ